MLRFLPLVVIFAVGCGRRNDPQPVPVPVPAVDANWIRPAGTTADVPRWGHRDGVSVGLWPSDGPPGLFRVYTPYLGHQHPRMINFISVEPVVKGVRAQSELDPSPKTGKPGIRFFSLDMYDDAQDDGKPAPPRFAPGRLTTIDGVPALVFDVVTEKFRNGAQPVLTVLFRKDRPHEVGFRVSATPHSSPMDSCVLSATMGNYARLRRIHLADETADSLKQWPKYTPDPLGFAPWRQWPREKMLLRNGERVVAATPDEPDPASTPMPGVHPAWQYTGKNATQYWRTADVDGLVVRANGRETFWGSNTPIPGGISFENFELEAPFRAGQEFWFGVTPGTPTGLGFK